MAPAKLLQAAGCGPLSRSSQLAAWLRPTLTIYWAKFPVSIRLCLACVAGRKARKLGRLHQAPITCLHSLPGLIVSGSTDGNIRIFDTSLRCTAWFEVSRLQLDESICPNP